MNKMKIALKYARALPVQTGKSSNRDMALSFAAEMMQLGFVPSQELFDVLETLAPSALASLMEDVIPVLREMKGAHVEHKPFYPNFPQQVMEMSHLELFLNAIMHYWSRGTWRPDYEKLPREFAFEEVKFQEIGVLSEEGFNQIFTRLLSSNESISEADKRVIDYFVARRELPKVSIPFKENLCYVAGLLINKGKSIENMVSTATDVLRIATALSDGDISLADNTRFKSFSRPTRRILVNALEGVIREDDILRHKSKWIRLFHSLHIGEYAGQARQIARRVRNGEECQSFNGKVEAALLTGDISEAVELLLTRPGDFARRLGHLLRVARSKVFVVESFLSVVDQVSTRVLLQLMGSLKTLYEGTEKRVVFPKGSMAKARIIDGLDPINGRRLDELIEGIQNSLRERFATLEPLGKVFIDDSLDTCPLPTQQRSASEGLFQVARGTALPIGDKGTLRFFIYWKGQDIDLSATLHDESFGMIEHISYTRLKSGAYQSHHSGDITYAPEGASEFIDITIDPAVKHGARYVVMNVYVYSGPNFSEHEECFAGWMTRSKPNSNEIFEPKTVVQKVDLRSESRNCIPVVFDLVERKAIWVDLTHPRHSHWGGNNVESNAATIMDTLEAIVSLDNKTTLTELFTLHAEARGELVEDRKEADVVFAVDGDVTPYDISVINSEYVAEAVTEPEPAPAKVARKRS